MSTEPQIAEATGLDPIAPPAKFDAEPVRRKSNRWIVVMLGIFLGIAGAVGLGVWQAKAYFQKGALERAANQKKSAEELAMQRPKRTFELEGSLPEAFEVRTEPPEPPPIAVVKTADVPAPSVAPVRRSMMVELESNPADTRGPDEDATEIAKKITAGNLAEGNGGPGGSLGAAGGTQPRPKTVQDFAKRTPGPVTKTPQALATMLGDRDYLLAKSASIPCTLQTQLNSNVAGPVKCVVSQNIYSDNGKVMLVERGSTIDGEYRNTLKTGDSRISVIWSRIKTPNGIVIDVDSPAADSVGTVGVAGDIDNHWMQRIGAAFLLSVVDDAIQLQTAKAGAQSAGANGAAQPYTSTTSTTKSIAEKVLDSTINIPPTLTRNRGERLMVLVNRDLWFDSVYQVTKR